MTLTVGIICGGRTGEHEVSLQSAWGIYHALDRARFTPLLVAIDHDGGWHAGEAEALLEHPHDAARIRVAASAPAVTVHADAGQGVLVTAGGTREVARMDVAFPIVHGTDGEDGALQGMLRLLGVPFVGSDVLGSAVGMDKTVMKRLLQAADLPVARWAAFREPTAADAAYEELARAWDGALFIKPAALGSSVGVSRAENAAQYREAVLEAFRYDRKVLVEEAVEGREIECSVLGNPPPSQWPPEASLPGEVIPQRGFYSYAAKYLDADGAELKVPAELPPETVARVQETALRAFAALEAEGLARIDFFLRPDGRVIVNEINTLPGFTPISMYPKLWDASGLPYPELLARLIDLALERQAARKALKTRVALPAEDGA